MNTHTADIQTILDEDGEPAFVVIPYHRYRELVEPRTALPHEVVGMVINKGYSLIKAWRTYLRLTQKDIARASGFHRAPYHRSKVWTGHQEDLHFRNWQMSSMSIPNCWPTQPSHVSH